MRYPEDVPVLTDGVVRLRAPRLDDVAAMVEMNTDPETQQWNSVPIPYGPRDAEQSVVARIPAGWRNGGLWSWAIESDGRYCGAVVLSGGEGGVGAVGFTLHPKARGQGLMTRAVRLVVAHAFDVLGWDRVTWGAFVGNWGSRRVAWRNGFRHLTTAYGGGLARGVRYDEWIASIGRDDEREPTGHWWDVPVIESDGLRLRAFRDDDVDRLIESSNDEHSLHWLTRIPQPYGREQAERFMASSREGLASGDRVIWVVADRETDLMLGDVGVVRLRNEDGVGEIGYSAHPEARGRGVMTAAVGLAIKQAFLPIEEGGFGRRRLELHAAKGNLPSIRVALNNGFMQTGVQRAADPRRDGSYEDLLAFDLLIDEHSS
jgi:RimJ/RimL family protein N-acetyltransferase